jgi:hypothetical protein
MSRPDIQAVSGDYVQGSFTLLSLSGERASSALFFARLMDSHAREGETKLAQRYFRAAVSEFRSIFDLLPADWKAANLAHEWARSDFKRELEAHPLIAVLIKVRNFAVHSARVQGFGRNFSVTVLGDGPERREDIPSLFIDALDRQSLGRELNDVSEESLHWFNRQIQHWPAQLIVQEAVFQASIPIRNFLVTAGCRAI